MVVVAFVVSVVSVGGSCGRGVGGRGRGRGVGGVGGVGGW